MKIISPMATGSGAYVIHSLLAQYMPGYRISGYHPYWTSLPFLLPVIVSTRNADLIHTTPDYARFFYLKSVPLVLTFHGYVLDGRLRTYCPWPINIHHLTDLRLWTRLAIKKAHTVTVVSHFLSRIIQQDQNISRPIKVIYNGIDENLFTPVPSSTSTSKEIRVLYSGNLTRRKGAHWLPSIARGLGKNIRIYYTQGLRNQNNLASNSKLQPIGSVPFKEMANRYRQMDLLVMPSVREGFGLAVAEAMSCGLPVVATNGSAIPELIDEGKGGFLCPVGDVNAFAEKINLLADSPKLRHEMGEYNRAKVKKMFTLNRMVKEYQELFEEVLG
jgi:glycosyltransferase involved in cell wall biosynthesis